MLKQYYKRALFFTTLFILLGITTHVVANTEGLKTAEDVDTPSEITINGTINRMGDKDIVIDDSLFLLAPSSGLNSSSFSTGQYIGGTLDDQGRIRSLHRKERTVKPKLRTEQKSPVGSATEKSVENQPLRHEGGVWKN